MNNDSVNDEVKALSEKEQEKLDKARKYRNNYFKKRYHSDPEFKARLKRHIVNSRNKRKEDYDEKQKKWREDNREKLKEYMREWRINNHENIKKYQREWYAARRLKKEMEKKRKKEKDLNS